VVCKTCSNIYFRTSLLRPIGQHGIYLNPNTYPYSILCNNALHYEDYIASVRA